jgi:MerR family transcriptional regulator, copper efflux regulator
MRIGEIARITGLKPGAVRYYESIGLLPEPEREPSGYRNYDDDALERLRFVTGARTLGLSLDEIADVIAAGAPDRVCCEHVVQLLEAQRDRIDEWIRGARALRDSLTETIEGSQGRADRNSPLGSCPVVERGLHDRALIAVDSITRDVRASSPFRGSLSRRETD